MTKLEELQTMLKNDSPWAANPADWEKAGYSIPLLPLTGFQLYEATVKHHAAGKPFYYMNADGTEKVFSAAGIGQAPEIEEPTQEEWAEQQLQMELDEVRKNNRLKTVSEMMKTPTIEWLVQDKIHRSGLCQIFGASYTGKTLAVLDLVMSWCAGLPTWQGYKLNNNGEPQQALYVAAEGGAALSVHVDAWLQYHEDVDPSRLDGLRFLDGGDGDHMFLSIDPKNPVEAEYSWDRMVKEILASELEPSIMVFDTQIDLAPTVDENSNKDMVGILRKIKTFADSLGFMAIVVHHTGHDGNKARGASGMMGKCDVQAKLTQVGSKPGMAKLEWTKVKGRALPKDTITYQISGSKVLPGLESEGAVCVPVGAVQAAVHTMETKAPDEELQGRIMKAVEAGALSTRKLSEAVQVDRNNTSFVEALEWMEYSALLKSEQKGRSKMWSLADFAVIPEDKEWEAA